MRLGEIVSLRWEQVDLKELILRGRGNQGREAAGITRQLSHRSGLLVGAIPVSAPQLASYPCGIVHDHDASYVELRISPMR